MHGKLPQKCVILRDENPKCFGACVVVVFWSFSQVTLMAIGFAFISLLIFSEPQTFAVTFRGVTQQQISVGIWNSIYFTTG